MSAMERIFSFSLSSCTGRLCRGYETRRSETYRCRWSIFECFGFSFFRGFLTFRHAVCDGHCTSGSRRCPVEWICQLLRSLRCAIFQGLPATIRALISHCTHTSSCTRVNERSYRLWLTRSLNLQHTYTHIHTHLHTQARNSLQRWVVVYQNTGNQYRAASMHERYHPPYRCPGVLWLW